MRTNLLNAFQVLSQIKQKARKEPNLLAVTYVSMCKVLSGYIPVEEFLNMDVTTVGEILDASIYLNRESEKISTGTGMQAGIGIGKSTKRGRR